MASMDILSNADRFEAIAMTSDDFGQMLHLYGMQQYLKACGPEVLDGADLLQWLVFRNTRIASVELGIARGEAVMFAETQWLGLGEHLAAATGAYSVGVYDLAVQIPGLFERVDQVSETPGTLLQLLEDTTTQRRSLQQYGAKMQREGLGYEIVNACDWEGRDSIPKRSTFNSFLRVSAKGSRADLLMYWKCCIYLACLVLRLHYHSWINQTAWPHHAYWSSIADVERDAYVQAINFCRMAPFCTTMPQGGRQLAAHFLSFPIPYFEESGRHGDELQWCRSMLRALQPRPAGLSPLSPSKHRLWDLNQIIANAVLPLHYRAKELR